MEPMKNTKKWRNRSFNDVLIEAKRSVEKMSEKQKNELRNKLNHGKAIIDEEDLLDMYLYCYGDVHRKKLLHAFRGIPWHFFACRPISVIDYGSGLGVADMVLSDYLKSQYISDDCINEFVLIEPSLLSLRKAINYMQTFMRNAEVWGINEKVENVEINEITQRRGHVVHLFSNIIDLPDVDLSRIADGLNRDNENNNLIICVSPFYQENGRGSKIREFGEKLFRYDLIYNLEKHEEEWDEAISCQIRIYQNSCCKN